MIDFPNGWDDVDTMFLTFNTGHRVWLRGGEEAKFPAGAHWVRVETWMAERQIIRFSPVNPAIADVSYHVHGNPGDWVCFPPRMQVSLAAA